MYLIKLKRRDVCRVSYLQAQVQTQTYYDQNLRMTKNYLFKLIMEHLKGEDTELVASLIRVHIELAKEFDTHQLAAIEDLFRSYEFQLGSCCHFFLNNQVYQRAIGARGFINSIPFLLVDARREIVRCFMSKKNGKNYAALSYTDCIDKNKKTGEIQGWVFANHRGKQHLPKLHFNNKYSIFTRKSNVAFYRSQHPSAYIEEYLDVPWWFGNAKLHIEASVALGSGAFDIKKK